MGDLADYIDERRSRGKPPRGLSEQEARKLFQQFMIAVDFWWALCPMLGGCALCMQSCEGPSELFRRCLADCTCELCWCG